MSDDPLERLLRDLARGLREGLGPDLTPDDVRATIMGVLRDAERDGLIVPAVAGADIVASSGVVNVGDPDAKPPTLEDVMADARALMGERFPDTASREYLDRWAERFNPAMDASPLEAPPEYIVPNDLPDDVLVVAAGATSVTLTLTDPMPGLRVRVRGIDASGAEVTIEREIPANGSIELPLRRVDGLEVLTAGMDAWVTQGVATPDDDADTDATPEPAREDPGWRYSPRVRRVQADYAAQRARESFAETLPLTWRDTLAARAAERHAEPGWTEALPLPPCDAPLARRPMEQTHECARLLWLGNRASERWEALSGGTRVALAPPPMVSRRELRRMRGREREDRERRIGVAFATGYVRK